MDRINHRRLYLCTILSRGSLCAKTETTQAAPDLFREHGILRTSEALALGIHPRTPYALRDAGALRRLALDFHGLTTQIPYAVDVAVKQGSQRPRLEKTPLRVFYFSDTAWEEGVVTYPLDDVPVRITNSVKSVVDSFKYRHKLGLDIALEALKRYRERDDFDVTVLLHYARVCRVKDVLRPYLEVLL